MNPIQDIWVYLSASPLLSLTVTLLAYQAGHWLYQKGGMNPLLNPVMLAVAALVALLLATGTDYRTYFDGAQFVHFLLGPATVAKAQSSSHGRRRSRVVGLHPTTGDQRVALPLERIG